VSTEAGGGYERSVSVTYQGTAMLAKVISGGQTGADLAGLRAAKAAGLETGGWMPKGYRTEAGNRPAMAVLYGMKEHDSREYIPRTKLNIIESDATLLFADDPDSPGSKATAMQCYYNGKPCLLPRVTLDAPSDPARWRAIAGWIEQHGIKTLNVAGNRESKAPGIGAWVEQFLAGVFAELKAKMEA